MSSPGWSWDIAVHERPLHLVPAGPNLVPFPSPKLLDLRQFKGSHAEKYLWGTYRPGYYLGEDGEGV